MKIDLKARYQTMDAVVADLEDYQVTVDPAAADAREHAREVRPDAVEEPEEEEEELVILSPDELLQAHGQAEAAPPGQPEAKAPARKNVLCVEAQAEIQDALRKNLSRMGYRVLLVGDAERAAERYREAPTDAVIFDVDGLGPEAIGRSTTCTRRPRKTGIPWSPSSCSAPARRPQGETSGGRSADRPLQAHQAQAGPGRDHRAPAGRMTPTCGSGRPAGTGVARAGDRGDLDLLARRRAGGRHRPKDRAIAFLSREVPRWSRENRCFSCHNNGDAARALYDASRRGYAVEDRRPGRHDRLAVRAGPLGPQRRRRPVQRQAAGPGPVRSRPSPPRIGPDGSTTRRPCVRAGDRLARDQAADGSWPLEGEDEPGSPATYGRFLATYLAREALASGRLGPIPGTDRESRAMAPRATRSRPSSMPR